MDINSNKTEMKRDRYPGIRSFEAHEEHLFYGRDSETKALYEQVTVQDLVIVFAKSGIGKSSLLNAGLIPRLLRDDYYPIRIRLQKQAKKDGSILSPLELVKQALNHYYKVALWQEFRPKGQAQPSCLWEYLHACRFPNKTPVLLFDQFEEFFNHNEADCTEFVRQLSDVLNLYPPSDVTSYLANIEHPNEAQTALYSRPPIKVVLAIRSDRLFELNALSEYIPLVLQNRFELQPLQEHNAREAVQKPAQRIGKMFTTNAFKYQDEFLTEVLGSLSEGGKKSIESFQLQIICQKIETQVRKNQETQPSQVVDKSYIVQNEQETIDQAIQRILNDYYEDQIVDIQEDYAQDNELTQLLNNVRLFIEDKLIDTPSEEATAGRRTIYGGTPTLSKDRTKNTAILERLVEKRLIRKEILSDGRFYYEITHDTLVEPILKSRAKRKAIERRAAEEAARIAAEEAARKERARLEEAARLQAEELAEETRKRKRANLLTAIAGITALISIVACIFAVIQYQAANSARMQAVESEKVAEEKRILAEQNEQKAKEKTSEALMKEAKNYLRIAEGSLQVKDKTNYEIALRKLRETEAILAEIEALKLAILPDNYNSIKQKVQLLVEECTKALQ